MVRLHKKGQSLEYRNAVFSNYAAQVWDGGKLIARDGSEFEPDQIGEDETPPALEDSLIEIIYMSHSSFGYGVMNTLDWIENESGFFDTYEKEDLAKLFALCEHKILNQPFHWGREDSDELTVPTLWSVTSRSYKSYEGEYDVEFDIVLKGELDMDDLKVKVNGTDIPDGVGQRE